MTHRLIQSLATELAGQFYEQKRSDRFRSKNAKTRVKRIVTDPRSGHRVEVAQVMPFFEAYPTSKEFSEGHWPLFVDPARRMLVTMLALSDNVVSPEHKEAIHEALVADRIKEYAGRGRRLIQASVSDVEKFQR